MTSPSHLHANVLLTQASRWTRFWPPRTLNSIPNHQFNGDFFKSRSSLFGWSRGTRWMAEGQCPCKSTGSARASGGLQCAFYPGQPCKLRSCRRSRSLQPCAMTQKGLTAEQKVSRSISRRLTVAIMHQPLAGPRRKSMQRSFGHLLPVSPGFHVEIW
jgi:hypothetical protein